MKLKIPNTIVHLNTVINHLFHYRGLLRGKRTSIREIMKGNLPGVEIISCENVRLQYSSPVFFDTLNKNPELSQGKEYIQYAIRVKNAIVYGDSNLIALSGNKVLFDMPDYDQLRRFRFNYANSKILKIKGNHVYYWKGLTQTADKAIWMGGSFSWNYYHLMYEYIIKFLQLNRLNIPLDVPVLVDQIFLDVPQYKELLDIVNHKGYPIVGVDRRYRVKVNELIYLNCPNFIPPNIKNDDGRIDDIQFNVSALQELKNYLLSYSSNKEFPKRIFLSRKNASERRKFNEDAVIKVFLEHGFEIVFPETLSVADQISLFNQAEWIAGGSGAAFTNLLFCKSKCNVIIFTKMRLPFSGFSTIANAFNINLLYLTEEDTGKDISFGDIHEAYEIDLANLKKQIIGLGL